MDPASVAKKAFFSPTIRELIRTSCVVIVKTSTPTAVKIHTAKRAAVRAKPDYFDY